MLKLAPPPPARQPRRPYHQHGLKAIAKGGICLLAADGLRRLIEHGAAQRLLIGQPELASDALRMLWCPGLLAVAGGLYLLQALLCICAGLHQRRSEVRVTPAPRADPRSPCASPARPCRKTDPHLQACVLLGLPPGSTWREIRKQWRRMVKRWHPDHGGDLQLWHKRLAAYCLLREREQHREESVKSI